MASGQGLIVIVVLGVLAAALVIMALGGLFR
jgi:hypothetical protein